MIKLLNTNSFLNKIAVQEASLGKFICPKCSTFFTNSKTEYEDHLRENHIDYDQVSCIYCAVSFDFSKISSHIESHFEENLMSTNTCNLCNTAVKMDSQESILDHLLFQHNNAIICPLCRTEYNDINQLLFHINENLKIVYHCTFEGCQMKTNDNEELNFHKNIAGHISDSCFEEHTFNCLSVDDENKFSYVDSENILPPIEKENSFMSNSQDEKTTGNNSSRINNVWQLRCRRDLFNSMYKNEDLEELSIFQKKLFTIDLYSIGIILENDKKLYCCLECDYTPQYSHWDVKKHILVIHCLMTEKESRTSLRFIEFNKKTTKSPLNRSKSTSRKSASPKKSISKLESLPSPKRKKSLLNQTPCSKSKFNYILKLLYRKDLVSQFFKDVNSQTASSFKKKINPIEQYSIGVMITNNKKAFYCLSCNYISYYSHGDVRKHILNFHCGISNKDARRCMRLVQIIDTQDTNELAQQLKVENDVISNTEPEVEAVVINETSSNVSIEEAKSKPKFTYMLKLYVRKDLYNEAFKSFSLEVCEMLKNKMVPIDNYSIGVAVNKTKKTFYCQLCDYVSHYSNWDVRKHILVWHCGINNTDSYKCTKLVEFKQEDVTQSDSEIVEDFFPIKEKSSEKFEKKSISKEKLIIDSNTNSKMVTPFMSDTGKLIKMNYSKFELKKVFPIASNEFLKEIESKMDNFAEYSLEISYIKGVKYYICIVCGYKSHYNQGDIKKHIMSKHCGISGNIVRDCIKLCKKDPPNESLVESKVKSELTISPKKSRNRSLILKLTRESCPVILKGDKQSSKKKYFISQDVTKILKEDPQINIEEDSRKRQSCFSNIETEKKPRLSLNSEEPPKITIEREVQLSYSENILKRLCTIENIPGQFPIIKDKLKKYSQHKIRIAKKFNSEIFICSSCNWFSWKSMCLVNRHIIEMHTGIDQNYVGLVEASSKLNTNGQLLSDNELSRLGWNGKPILS